MFAERYSLEQARRFDRLRLPSGKRLSRRHVITLLFVSPKQAKTLTAKVRWEGWSAVRLELEVKRLRPKRRLGGRPPRQPESRTEAVVQLIASSERWLHRYRACISNSRLKDPLRARVWHGGEASPSSRARIDRGDRFGSAVCERRLPT